MKLQDLLSALKTQIKPDPASTYRQVIEQIEKETKNKKRVFIKSIAGASAALVLFVLVGLYTFNYFRFDASNNLSGDTASLSQITYVAADQKQGNGVASNSTLTIVTKERMSANQLEEHLSITPEVPYIIKKTGGNRFSLRFEEPLKNDASYTVNSLVGNATVYRWSLQTEYKYSIESVFPANHSAKVDCNTAIRVTFTESGVNAFQECFSIYPEVNGSFTHKGRIWTFTPDAPLLPYTTYTVTISGDINGNDEIALGEDRIFSFTTGAGKDERYAYVISDTFDIADTFSTAQSPSVTIGAKGLTTSTADMTLYKLPDAKTYLALHKKYGQDTVLSTAIITDVKDAKSAIYSQFSVSAIPDPEQKNVYHFNYPKELESGYYLTEILWNEIKCYQLIQSHDLAVYSSTLNGSHTFWVNNTQTKLPADGVKIELGNVTGKTDNNGMSTLTANSSEDGYLYATIKANSLPPYILCCKATDRDIGAMNKYNAYLYTDSTEYNTDGTIRLWGTVSKRFADAETPKVTVSFSRDLASYPISLKSDNSFNLEIPFEGLESGEITIALAVNGESIREQTIQICAEEEKKHQIHLKTDKNAYFVGEIAKATVYAGYSDHSPAAGIQVKLNEQAQSVTDKSGFSTIDLTLAAGIGDKTNVFASYAPSLVTNKAVLSSNGKDLNSATQPILVFGTNEYIAGTILNKSADSCTLSIKTGVINVDKLNALAPAEFANVCSDLKESEYFGNATNRDVVIEIHDISFDRTQIGTYFDAASNKIQLKYSYKEKDTVVKSVTAKTVNGNVVLDGFTFPSASGYRYLKLITKTAAGTECSSILYIDHPIEHEVTSYKFSCVDHAAHGEEIALKVYDPTAKLSLQEGSFIYHISHDNTYTSAVAAENNTTFVFDSKMGNKIDVCGVYFDGRQYMNILPKTIMESQKSQYINVAVSTDKTAYSSGEEAIVTVTVKDGADKPIKNSALCLNLSINSSNIAPSKMDVRNQIAQNDNPIIFTNLPSAAKQEVTETIQSRYSVRSLGFYTAKTNGDGIAEIKLTLPQEAGTWNAYVQAINANAQFGCKSIEMRTKSAFDIKYYLSDVTTPLDDAILSFSCNGEKLTSASIIQTQVTLTKDDAVIQNHTLQHNLETQNLNFGKLPVGEYSIKVKSAFGSESKEILCKLSVKQSALNITDVTQFDQATGTVQSVLLTDKSNALWVEQLEKLYSDGAERIDRKLGRVFAETVYDQKTAAQSFAITQTLRQYCIDGGYSVYYNDQKADLLLTARIASLFPENVNKSETIQYFNAVLCDTESTYEEVLCALWGKAALGEAVEKDLAYYYAEGNGLTSEQQLYFALAYAYGGNQEKAYDIYINRIKTMLLPNEEKLMLSPDDANRTEHCNSILSLLLTRISAKEAPQVLSHVLTIDSNVTLASLERIGYVKEYAPVLDGTNTVEIGIADVGAQTINYPKCSYIVLSINAPHSDLGIKDDSQNTHVSAFFSSAAHEWITLKQKAGAIGLTAPTAASINSDVSLTLTLTPDQMQSGKLHIKLPDGLRCLNITSTTKFFDYAINEVSNDVVITLENDVPTTITLGCKAAKLGQFTVYPMFIIADSGNAYHCTAACALQITDANVAPENTEGIPETQQPDQPDNTLDEQPSPVPTQPEPTPQV